MIWSASSGWWTKSAFASVERRRDLEARPMGENVSGSTLPMSEAPSPSTTCASHLVMTGSCSGRGRQRDIRAAASWWRAGDVRRRARTGADVDRGASWGWSARDMPMAGVRRVSLHRARHLHCYRLRTGAGRNRGSSALAHQPWHGARTLMPWADAFHLPCPESLGAPSASHRAPEARRSQSGERARASCSTLGSGLRSGSALHCP